MPTKSDIQSECTFLELFEIQDVDGELEARSGTRLKQNKNTYNTYTIYQEYSSP